MFDDLDSGWADRTPDRYAVCLRCMRFSEAREGDRLMCRCGNQMTITGRTRFMLVELDDTFPAPPLNPIAKQIEKIGGVKRVTIF